MEAGGSQWVYTSDHVFLVVQVVDAALVGLQGGDDTTNVDQDLALFQQICSSSWLANTPVLVLLSNVKGVGKEPEQEPTTHAVSAEDSADFAKIKFRLRDLFLGMERKYKMRVWVDFIRGGATSDIGRAAIKVVDAILTEESVLNYGVR